MIDSIKIKNFRCFKDTKIAEFGLVNLLGGKNNSGKTALLEALFIAKNADDISIMILQRQIRKSSLEFEKKMPENTWNSLFFQQDKEQTITLVVPNNTVILSCCKKVKGLTNLFDEKNNELGLSNKKVLTSVLNVNKKGIDGSNFSFSLKSTEEGIEGMISNERQVYIAHFISTSSIDSSELAKSYDAVRYNLELDEGILLEAFQIIDKTIEKVDVFSIGEPILYLQRKNEKRMPIGLFGDAIIKVADFILRIINNPNSIILIDEIENGIHFTNQEKLWKMLFDLAIEYKVQIFATTHSLEMAKAFISVINECKFHEKAKYFELAKHAKTANIVVANIPIDILDYDIENNFPFRGE